MYIDFASISIYLSLRCTKLDMDAIESCAPDGYVSSLKCVISEYLLRIKFMRNSCKIALRWMTRNILDDKWILVPAMDWYR